MKQAIVTGATGFIGSYFVEYLISKNIKVLALGRKDYNEISEIRKSRLVGATYLKIDMRNISTLNIKISEINWVINDSCVFINLAWGGENKLSDLNIDIQMQKVILTVNAFK